MKIKRGDFSVILSAQFWNHFKRLWLQWDGASGSPHVPLTAKNIPWWDEFEIYSDVKKRRVFIGIGTPTNIPPKIYESPLLEAKRYQKMLFEPHIETQADIARELGFNDTIW